MLAAAWTPSLVDGARAWLASLQPSMMLITGALLLLSLWLHRRRWRAAIIVGGIGEKEPEPERPEPEASPTRVIPPEHPYYQAIDQTTRRFRSEHVINRSEARRRARYRSHDPRRWRCVFYEDDEIIDDVENIANHLDRKRTLSAPAAPAAHYPTPDADYPLYDWKLAERAINILEKEHGLHIQHPPLAYSDESARRLSKEAGCSWYFSIADFDEALLNGSVTLRHTDGDQTMVLPIDKPIDTEIAELAKPALIKKQSPSGIMDI